MGIYVHRFYRFVPLPWQKGNLTNYGLDRRFYSNELANNLFVKFVHAYASCLLSMSVNDGIKERAFARYIIAK